MSYTNSTAHYSLPQYVASDVPSILSDVNTAYSNIDTAIYNVASAQETAASTVSAINTRLTTAEGEIDTLQSDLDTAETGIETNASAITALNTTVSTLSSTVSTNTTNIASLDSEIDNIKNNYVIASPDQTYTYTTGDSDTFGDGIPAALNAFLTNVVQALDNDESVRIINLQVGELVYAPEYSTYFTNTNTSISAIFERVNITATGANIREIFSSNTTLSRFYVMAISSDSTITFTDYSALSFASSPITIEYEVYKQLT